MVYDQALAEDIRAYLAGEETVTEREMFGGIAFMIQGNMAVGVTGEDLMVRVGKERHDAAMARPGTRVFDLSGRPMAGWILVAAEEVASPSDLHAWIDWGAAYARSLPAK
jgi:hypothetical protein